MVVGKIAQSKDLANNFAPKIPYRGCSLRFKTPLEHMPGDDNVTMCLSMRAVRKLPVHQSKECNIKNFGGTLKTRKSPLKINLHLFNQLDDFYYPHARINKKFTKRSTKRNNSMEKTSPNCVHNSSRTVWCTGNSDQCSVASCSSNDVGDYGGRISPKLLENTPYHSDAESSSPSLYGKRDLPSSPVDKVVDVHELELRAYKSTVAALYV